MFTPSQEASIRAIIKDEIKKNDTINNILGFIKQESEGIAQEVTDAVHKSLTTAPIASGLQVYVPDNFMKIVKDPITGQHVTDLDGVLILSNSDSFAGFVQRNTRRPENVTPMHIMLKENEKRGRIAQALLRGYRRTATAQEVEDLTLKDSKQPGERNILVIIEAKHQIDSKEIEEKVLQVQKLNSILQIAKQVAKGDLSQVPEDVSRSFITTCITFKLDLFDKVLLYIGGPVWDKDAMNKVRQYKEYISGIVRPAGKRYLVFEQDNNYTRFNGGRKNPTKPRRTPRKLGA